MVFPFSFFQETNPENLAPNTELTEHDLKELADKLSNKVHKELLLQETYMKDTEAFLAARKSEAGLNSAPRDRFNHLKNDLSQNLQCPAPELTFPVSSSSQSVDSQQIVAQVKREYLRYLYKIDPDQFKGELIEFFRNELDRLTSSNPRVKFRITLGRKHRKRFVGLSKNILTGFILFFIFKLVIAISRIITSWLQIILQILMSKIWGKKVKSKKQSTTEEDQEEKSKNLKKIWDKPGGWLNKVGNIGRGGSFVQVQETNIYQFSLVDQEEALQIVSPISTFSKPETQTQGKFSKLKSKIKNLISFPAPYKLIKILLGLLIFLEFENNIGIISLQTQNFSNVERVLPTQRFTMPMQEPRAKEAKIIMSIPIHINKPLKTSDSISSGVKSLKQPRKISKLVRKKAKLVRLSDLPPLQHQYSNLDSEMMPILTPTNIRIKTR